MYLNYWKCEKTVNKCLKMYMNAPEGMHILKCAENYKNLWIYKKCRGTHANV